MLPLQTERSTLRIMRIADAPALASYRNLPDIAHFQSWPMPFDLVDAQRMLAEQEDIDRLPTDGWVQIAIEVAGEVVGDLGVGMSDGGLTAEIGFTLAPQHHGKGYASEAAGAMIDALFARSAVRRIVATIDPENTPSMRVIEHLGFRFEGLARRSVLVRGQWVDDMQFALLREDRVDWLSRPTSCDVVELVEIDDDNLRDVSALATHRHQERFVSPMNRSFAQIVAPPMHGEHRVVPAPLAVRADGEIVGFMLLSAVSPGEPVPYLWRFLIDRRHQRRGVGRRAISALADRFRAEGHDAILLSWVDAPGGPKGFYERLGFVPTGVVVDGEFEGRLAL